MGSWVEGSRKKRMEAGSSRRMWRRKGVCVCVRVRVCLRVEGREGDIVSEGGWGRVRRCGVYLMMVVGWGVGVWRWDWGVFCDF